jgi:hypothetical protein
MVDPIRAELRFAPVHPVAHSPAGLDESRVEFVGWIKLTVFLGHGT